MQSSNPVFNRSEAFSRRGYAGFNEAPPIPGQQLEDMYNAPAATGLQTGRMTIDDVVVKTGLMFAVLVPLAGLNFYLASPLLTWGGMIAGLILGLVISFKQSTNAALMLATPGSRACSSAASAPSSRRSGVASSLRRCSAPCPSSGSRCSPTRAVGCGSRRRASASR